MPLGGVEGRAAGMRGAHADRAALAAGRIAPGWWAARHPVAETAHQAAAKGVDMDFRR